MTHRYSRRTLVAGLGAFVLALGTGSALAQIEIKLGHVGEPGSLFAKSSEEFARRANAKLGDKAKVVVYGSSQLGGDKELLQKLKLGTVDLAVPSTVMSSEVDLFGIFELPYLVKDREHMKRIEKDVVWPSLAPAAEQKGLKIVAVCTALQTGVMDGQENPFTQIYSAKFQEVQKYLSLTGHVYTPAYLTAGAKKWATLPADVRKTLEDTAKETQAYVYETAAKDEEDLLGKLKAGGIAVNTANKDAFISASKAVYDEFGQDVKGAQPLIDRAIALGK
jgi:TRAP-type C4-dicarboxylate transport system substrate-binding protein